MTWLKTGPICPLCAKPPGQTPKNSPQLLVMKRFSTCFTLAAGAKTMRQAANSTSRRLVDLKPVQVTPTAANTLSRAHSNRAEQFAGSPDLDSELNNAIIDALDAHTAMSTQALNSPAVLNGVKELMLNHFALHARLLARAMDQPKAP